MSQLVVENSLLWKYMSPQQERLLKDGELLIDDRALHPSEHLSDYSYLVFPFAKLFEGFLKQWFRDLEIISVRDYQSDHFRIGKVLSPNLVRRLGGRSAYALVEKRYGREIADRLWKTWKEARNLVFHYFPHNYRALSQADATRLVGMIVDTMQAAVSLSTGTLGESHIP